MLILKAKFDGKKIVLPPEMRDYPPSEVVVIVEDLAARQESNAWSKAQETAFAKAWDNDEDAIYDSL